VELLREAGLERVRNLRGGLAAWRDEADGTAARP
jgi:rhodanese-related sulfurtransferase